MKELGIINERRLPEEPGKARTFEIERSRLLESASLLFDSLYEDAKEKAAKRIGIARLQHEEAITVTTNEAIKEVNSGEEFLSLREEYKLVILKEIAKLVADKIERIKAQYGQGDPSLRIRCEDKFKVAIEVFSVASTVRSSFIDPKFGQKTNPTEIYIEILPNSSSKTDNDVIVGTKEVSENGQTYIYEPYGSKNGLDIGKMASADKEKNVFGNSASAGRNAAAAMSEFKPAGYTCTVKQTGDKFDYRYVNIVDNSGNRSSYYMVSKMGENESKTPISLIKAQ